MPGLLAEEHLHIFIVLSSIYTTSNMGHLIVGQEAMHKKSITWLKSWKPCLTKNNSLRPVRAFLFESV